MATIIVNEDGFNKILAYKILNEEISKKDIIDTVKGNSEIENRIKDVVKKVLRDDSDVKKSRDEHTKDVIKNNKDLELRIRNLIADMLIKYNRTLWQRSSFIDSEIRSL